MTDLSYRGSRFSSERMVWLLDYFGEQLEKLKPGTLARIARILAAVWFIFIPIRRSVALSNIKYTFKDQLAWRGRLILCYRMASNIILNYLEFISFPHIDRQAGIERFNWLGLDILNQALKAQKGVLVLSAHIGAFDQLAMATALRGYPVTVLSRTPRDRAVGPWWMRVRARAGVEILSERGSLKDVLRALKLGRIVVFVIDQDMKVDRGVFVPFFGRLACTTDALAILALRTGAPLIPALTWRDSAGAHQAQFSPPLSIRQTGNLREDIVSNTAAFSSLVEGWVRSHPTQWLWLHRRWKSRPPEEKPFKRWHPGGIRSSKK